MFSRSTVSASKARTRLSASSRRPSSTQRASRFCPWPRHARSRPIAGGIPGNRPTSLPRRSSRVALRRADATRCLHRAPTSAGALETPPLASDSRPKAAWRRSRGVPAADGSRAGGGATAVQAERTAPTRSLVNSATPSTKRSISRPRPSDIRSGRSSSTSSNLVCPSRDGNGRVVRRGRDLPGQTRSAPHVTGAAGAIRRASGGSRRPSPGRGASPSRPACSAGRGTRARGSRRGARRARCRG